jgi:hypothetical protein
MLHLNELTLLIQRAGPGGAATKPTTSFAPLKPLPDVIKYRRDYRADYRSRKLEGLAAGLVEGLHKS